MKIRKYQLFTFLNFFKDKGCKNIDDIIDLINKELKNDTDVVFIYGDKGGVSNEFMDKKSR
jgi:hypothetical protein